MVIAMTNRDWIATLTDEELAKHLEFSCNSCVYEPDSTPCGDCVGGVLEWLKSEHDGRIAEGE